MKKYFVLAALLLTFSSKAQMRWDKMDNNTIVHFSVGIGTGNAVGIFGNTPKQRVIFGLTSGALVGYAKERYDMSKGTQYGQWHDVLSTAVGGVVGAMMVNWAVKRSKNYTPKNKFDCKM
jgi:uncharacterized protein YfiM (DUF2279 family)